MNEQQGMGEKEIRLIDLMFYCLERWRWILISMLALGILAGGYKYQATVRDNQSRQKEALAKKESGETEKKGVNEQSAEAYEQALEGCERDIEMQKDYLDNSVVMQLDPYHVSTGTLVYYIESGEHLDSLIAAYRSYVTDGRMAEQLYKEDGEIEVSDLHYLITFSSKERETYRLEDNQVMRPAELVFQVQIKMPEGKQCQEYLETAEELMEACSSQLGKAMTKHDLRLLSSVKSEKTDSELQSYQAAVWNTYLESVRKLQTLQTEMDAVESLEDDGTAGTSGDSSAALANPFSSSLKYAAAGLVLGAFLTCFAAMLVYIMGGRLQDTRTFSGEFGMPMLGLVRDIRAKKRWFGFIDEWIYRLEEGAYARLGFEEQARLAAANVQAVISKDSEDNGKKKIMLAGTVAEKEVASLCAQLTADMKEITWSPYTQIVFQAEALEELGKYDGILFVEKKRVSAARFIMKERNLALDRDVKVLGAVVVC